MRVELRCATVPFLGALAEHYWFVAFDGAGQCERWEVWQSPNAGGESFGHLHRDLKLPDEGVGAGPARIRSEWRGEDAVRIISILRKSKDLYPYFERYFPWPGPNSNTFVAWVLREAGIAFVLPWKALGKDYA